MAIWLALIGGLIVGTTVGGWRAVSLGRRDDFVRANRWLRWGGWASAMTTIAVVVLMLRWPYLTKTESFMQEISRTVTETVEVPYEVSSWYFWTKKETRIEEIERTIVELVPETRDTHHFSVLLLLAMGLLGMFAFYLEMWVVRIIWRNCR